MEFLKKHYEKILLGIVLLLAIGAFASLPFIIGMERAKLEDMRTSMARGKIPEVPPADLALENATLERLQAGVRWDLTRDHNTVNPVLWMKDGQKIIKMRAGQELRGPSLLEITAIKPLHLILTFNGLDNTNSYKIGFKNEAVRGYRGSGESIARINEKKELFTLVAVVGPPDAPTALNLEMNDTLEKAALVGTNAFKRIEGYAADLKYPPENKTFNDQRKDSPPLTLSGVKYKIIVITRTNVIVSAPNDRRYPITNFNAVP